MTSATETYEQKGERIAQIARDMLAAPDEGLLREVITLCLRKQYTITTACNEIAAQRLPPTYLEPDSRIVLACRVITARYYGQIMQLAWEQSGQGARPPVSRTHAGLAEAFFIHVFGRPSGVLPRG